MSSWSDPPFPPYSVFKRSPIPEFREIIRAIDPTVYGTAIARVLPDGNVVLQSEGELRPGFALVVWAKRPLGHYKDISEVPDVEFREHVRFSKIGIASLDLGDPADLSDVFPELCSKRAFERIKRAKWRYLISVPFNREFSLEVCIHLARMIAALGGGIVYKPVYITTRAAGAKQIPDRPPVSIRSRLWCPDSPWL